MSRTKTCGFGFGLKRILSFPKLSCCILGLTAASLLAPGAAWAADVFWNDAAGGNWSDGTKWSTGSPPGPADNAFITLDGTYTVNLNVNATVASLSLGAAAGTQTLELVGRTLTLDGSSIVG